MRALPEHTNEPAFSVRLVSITNPLVEAEGRQLTPEEFVVYTARVSNPSNQANLATAPKLLRYLVDKKHWSPFEMVGFTVEIITSRGIAQQILRHRSFSFQEFSLRYAEATDIIRYPARQQAPKNRQASTDTLSVDDRLWWERTRNFVNTYCQNRYQEAIERGVARESARWLLPIATQTTLFMSGTVRSWIHYLQVRTEEGVQPEHRDIAVAIRDTIFAPKFPCIAEALGWKPVTVPDTISRT